MIKKIVFLFMGIIIITLIGFIFINKRDMRNNYSNKEFDSSKKINGYVIFRNDNSVTIQNKKNVIYTLNTSDDIKVGQYVQIGYSGKLNNDKEVQDVKIVGYKNLNSKANLLNTWNDNGIFSKYYNKALNSLKKMSLQDKIGQLLLVRYPDNDTLGVNALKEYKLGGYVFFGKDFKNKNKSDVEMMIKKLQAVSSIPIITAVDEEGGTVVRVSSNKKLVQEKFKSPSEIYKEGGFEAIKKDTITKSEVLHELGLNLNLAPVVDVSVNSSDYMYSRALGLDSSLTSEYAKQVIEASHGTSVSYTLKHFPGYGNNVDTHTGSSIDKRSFEEIVSNDLPPFEAGIKAGTEAVLVSHNVVSSVDDNNPASLSNGVHNLLRSRLSFTGIIMTDDLDMGATSEIKNNVVKAIEAGNDMMIVTDYKESVEAIDKAIKDGQISENLIDKLAFRVIAWKYYKGLLK